MQQKESENKNNSLFLQQKHQEQISIMEGKLEEYQEQEQKQLQELKKSKQLGEFNLQEMELLMQKEVLKVKQEMNG